MTTPVHLFLGEEIWGGDGAYVALLNDGLLRYASFQNGQIYRIEYNASNQLVSWALVTPSLESSYLFIHPYVIDPNDSDIMYLPGNQEMYRNASLSSIPDFQTVPHTTGWQELTNTAITGGGVISAVVASESNPDHRVYYGTSAGEVYRIDDAHTGDPAATNVTSGLFPAGYVSSIAVHPDDADRVAVVFSNYSVQSVFYSDDAGATWANVSGTLEENADGSGSGPSVRWIKMGVISGADTQYFVGTSTGLYSATTLDGTSTVWTQEGSSTIGNVVIDMIDIRDSDGYIAVGTHGNGFYSSMLERPTITITGPAGIVDGLSVWLKADAGVTESAGDVSAWNDQSGNGYHFSDGGNSAYTYDAAGLNYNPEITNADGSNRRLENTSSITLQTVFLVTDPDNPDVFDNPFSEANADDEGIRVHDMTSTNWNVPGDEEDFTNTSGQGWLNGTSGTDPAHANEPNILVVEAPAAASIAGGIELGDTKSNRFWHGSIAEIVGYAGTLTTTEREQIQTYLAIKYGITVSNDYLASDASTIWDATANASYHNDVAGIGRDDASDLNQKQSDSDIISIALGTKVVDNASNSNTFTDDLSFLLTGHDGTAITETDVMFGSSEAKLLDRTWFVQQTGTNELVELQFDLSQVSVTGTELTDFWLILDTDTDPVTDHRLMIPATSFTSDIVTFTDITLENNDYMMLVTSNPGDALLPVELAGFDGVYNEGNVLLSWSTLSETNNAGFEVQRRTSSEAQSDWITLAFVEGEGHANEEVRYSFSDDVRTMAGSILSYRLKQIDFDGSVALSEEVSVDVPAPDGYALSAYPNPFNPVATIEYAVPSDGHVTLVVFDLQGRQVATLIDEAHAAGRYTVPFDASSLASGTYVYRLEAQDNVLTNTIMLLK